MAALSLKDRAADMCAKLGLASTGKLKPDVDALCEATELPFTQIKETVDALSSLCDFATEVVPKLCEDVGCDATGKLVDDVKTLCSETGVEQAKFPLALKELVESMGVDVKPAKLQNFLSIPMLAEAEKKQNKKSQFKAPKVVDIPCTCDLGVEGCKTCRADDHPCVCSSILIHCTDQPMKYCKAKTHECLCRYQGLMTWTRQPKCYPDLQMNWETSKYERYHASASLLGLCRQHPTDRDDDVKSEPKKKKSRTG